jgi:uncharacterized protein
MSQSSTANNHARGWTQALARAAEAGDARLVGELLAAGATADVRLEGGATPLMRAAARGFHEAARVLLDAGADVNARRGDGFTPLILAVFFGHEELVRLLLERGADPSAQTQLGVGARGWADARGFETIAELLRRAPEPPARPAAATPARSTVVAAPTGREILTPEPEERVKPRGPETARDVPSYEPQFYPPARGFAWSWQAAVGVVLLAAACGVGGLALWQRSRGAASIVPASPSAAGASQPARPLPSPAAPDLVAQPTPAPLTDVHGGALPPDMPGAIIIQPDPSAQPALVTPDAAGAASASAPSVVSESKPEPAPEEATPRREPRDTRGETVPPPAGRRDEPRRADDTDSRADEAARRDRSPEVRPTDPPPAPSATPRRRVIQWPP